MKLNVLLAKTDHLASSFRKSIEDYLIYFKNKQTDFRGERKTYEPRPGSIDIPGKRENKVVVTTVDEKLRWLEENSKEFIDALFSLEASNAAGLAKCELIVDGEDFGVLSSLELLRLKSLLENGTLEQMYSNIPVRSDSEIWNENTNEMYVGRSVFETPKISGVEKSTEKESYILHDPNIKEFKEGSHYAPQIATKNTVIELGDYSFQRFSGEWSHRQRAELLKRRTRLLTAVIEALKICNEAEAISSPVTSEKIFRYLHKGV
jgi:hypothetical protein